jgi:hypothetical protein
VSVKRTGRSFSAHPARLAGAFLAISVLAVIGWYLGSPLFVRTYRSEPLPSAAPSLAAPTIAAPTSSPRPTRSGELGYVDTLHNGKGVVRLLDLGSSSLLRFDDVAITNAPDVHVYLSRETGGRWSEATSLYLGGLKATNGSFNYEIPAGVDLSSYRSVVVWCRAFRVLITWADLEP